MADVVENANTIPSVVEDNTGGNNENTGVEAEFDAFWEQADEEQVSTPTQAPASNPLEVINQALNAVEFGDFSREELGQLEQGDFTGLNQRIATAGRVAMQQTLLMSARMMNAQREQIMAQVKEQLNQRIGQFQQDSQFEEQIPFSQDPAIRPIARGIFDMALKKANGDAAKASTMTKQFMTHLSGKLNESGEHGQLPTTRNTARSKRNSEQFDFISFLQNG